MSGKRDQTNRSCPPPNNSASGTTPPFSPSVAKFYSRPTGLRYRSGLSTKLSLGAVAKTYPKNNAHGKLKHYERGNIKITEQGGNYPRKIFPDRILQPHVLNPEEGRLISPSYRSQSAEQVHKKRTLPDGKLAMRKTNYKSTGCYGQVRSQGRLLNSRRSSRFSGPGLSVPSPAIWPEHSTTGFHKIAQASSGISPHTQHQTSDLSGRHPSGGVKPFDFAAAHAYSDKPAPRSGVHNQFREVDFDTNPDTRVPRIHNQLSNYEVLSTSGEDNEDFSPVQILNEGESNIITSPISTVGLSRVLSTSSMACSTPFSAPSVVPDRASSVEQWELSRYSPPEQTGARRTAMVDSEYPSGQWKSNTSPLIRNDYRIGCLQDGLGGHLWLYFDQRTLVTRGESSPHKCSGTEGGISCNTIIPETSVKHSSETAPGQYDSCLVHQQPGRNPLFNVNVSDTRTVKLVSTTQYFSEGGISSGCPERPSGQRIESVHRRERLENTISDNKTFSQGQGNRPVCHQIDKSTATLCELAPRSPRFRNRRVYSGLEFHEGICIPPFNLIPCTLMKVRDDNATLLLVAPIWQAQHWWPLLLQLAISLPVRLPLSPTLLEDPSNLGTTHPMYPRLRLAVWLISNNAAQQKAFRVQLPDCCLPPHNSRQTKPMTLHGASGVAGVIQGKLIQFRQISEIF